MTVNNSQEPVNELNIGICLCTFITFGFTHKCARQGVNGVEVDWLVLATSLLNTGD